MQLPTERNKQGMQLPTERNKQGRQSPDGAAKAAAKGTKDAAGAVGGAMGGGGMKVVAKYDVKKMRMGLTAAESKDRNEDRAKDEIGEGYEMLYKPDACLIDFQRVPIESDMQLC